MKRFSKWMFTLFGLLVLILLMFAFCVPQSAVAQGGYPLGADIITSATNYWVVCTMTNTVTNASPTVVTSNIVVAAMNPKRVRLTIKPDAYTDGYVNYGPFGDTNLTLSVTSSNVFLPLTNGWPLVHGASPTNWVSQRPGLWKDAISVTVVASITTNVPSTNITFRITDETGSY